ncbi:peptidase S41 [Geothrix limicola]|uniref:Peptidase S41 n=1 Tax=Geothrix limicola TaxID=2927978 RepID=A0ABQ5QJ09_9BACT|nr:S41 family peptidase [Geothrix limicola]GLH74667.1 peptidase S41 [Geothrix limicola]
MHSRTWLSVLSLPLVAAFTMPVMQQGNAPKPQSKAGAKAVPQDPLAGLSDIQDVLSLVQQNYVDPPDMDKVVSGGVQAVLERSHPLNAYLSAEDLRLPDPGPAEAGMIIVKRGIYATVAAVTPGGPATKAGIQAGDVIRKVDGDSVGRLSAWALERKLRGPDGSSLDLYRYNATGDLTKTTVQRQRLTPGAVAVKHGQGALMVSLPDLDAGRAEEVKKALAAVDHGETLVLDLRQCQRGAMTEAAALAGALGAKGAFATLQEAGKPDREIPVSGQGTPFAHLALLVGRATLGAPEVLASCLKKGGAKVLGERTPGLGVERTRFLLKQGGAVELVSKRWVGLGGEKLDRQGIVPDQVLRMADTEDALARVMTALATPAVKAESQASHGIPVPKLEVPPPVKKPD